MDQTFGWWFYFPCECGAFPMLTPTENIDTEKWPPSLFKQYVSKHTECRESYIPSKKVRHQWRVCFQASIKNSLDSKRWDLQVYPEDLTSRVKAVYFPTLSVAWKHIPMSYWECPCGNRLWECVWKCWLPYCSYTEEVTFNWNWAGRWSLRVACLFEKSQRMEQSSRCQK